MWTFKNGKLVILILENQWSASWMILDIFRHRFLFLKRASPTSHPGQVFGVGGVGPGEELFSQQNLKFKDIFNLGTGNTKPVFWEPLKAGISCALLNAEGLTREQKVLISSSKDPASSSLPSALALGAATWRSYKKGGYNKKGHLFCLRF